MTPTKGQIIISYDNPTNTFSWNQLAEKNNNLFQSTYFDEDQKFFRQQPIYLELWKDNILLMGVKLYYFKSRKLPGFLSPISQTLKQYGEYLKDESITGVLLEESKKEFSTEIKKIAENLKVPVISFDGCYGGEDKLLDDVFKNYPFVRFSEMDIAMVVLAKPLEELWKGIDTKHRGKISKAEKNNLQFSKEDNIDEFLKLLDNTYEAQGKHGPNKEYIRHQYNLLKKNNLAELFFVKKDDEYLSAALNEKYGTMAFYTFAGNKKNNFGSGQFLHWNIIKQYHGEGIQYYFLGEAAKEVDDKNLKFSEGISSFKRRFGTTNVPSVLKTYLLRPTSHKTWKMVQAIFSKISKAG